MPLLLPHNETKILLHTCCAPCSCSIIDLLLENSLTPLLFFYNPNIHPQEEYAKRKSELLRYARKRGVSFVDADYDVDAWFQEVQGLEEELERGKRCTVCFEMRLAKAAEYASQNCFRVLSSTLGISRWKNLDQITAAGKKAVVPFPDLIYFDYNWRKGDAQKRAKEISTQENFYRQSYCGCVFSKRG
jgi:predicted adenine nucleotide alpha hydrolase (AANH) superfamily ATPase